MSSVGSPDICKDIINPALVPTTPGEVTAGIVVTAGIAVIAGIVVIAGIIGMLIAGIIGMAIAGIIGMLIAGIIGMAIIGALWHQCADAVAVVRNSPATAPSMRNFIFTATLLRGSIISLHNLVYNIPAWGRRIQHKDL